NYNTPLVITFTGTDIEQCELTFTTLSSPTHGSVGSITNQLCAAASPNADSATITYTPTNGYSGPDSFTYQVNDGTANSVAATVAITVNAPGNTLPTSAAKTVSTNYNTASP